MPYSFSIRSAWSLAFQTYKANWKKLTLIFITIIIPPYALLLVLSAFLPWQKINEALVLLFAYFWFTGSTYIGIRFAENNTFYFREFGVFLPKLPKLIIGHLLAYGIMAGMIIAALTFTFAILLLLGLDNSTTGFVCLAITGLIAIIWAMRFQLVSYFILAKEMNPLTAIKVCHRAGRGQTFKIAFFLALCSALESLGVSLIFVGFLFTGPLAALFFAYGCREMTNAMSG